jgi:hypothetical protein
MQVFFAPGRLLQIERRQDFANEFGGSGTIGNASVTDGRDGSPSGPRVVLARAVASARRPYLSLPAVTEALQQLRIYH